jgi:hypothetical protein
MSIRTHREECRKVNRIYRERNASNSAAAEEPGKDDRPALRGPIVSVRSIVGAHKPPTRQDAARDRGRALRASEDEQQDDLALARVLGPALLAGAVLWALILLAIRYLTG